MLEVVSIRESISPLLVSFPHSGTSVPEHITQRFSPAGRCLTDTDWHVPRLYGFLQQLPVSTISANYSRYVIDVNRSIHGKALYPGQRETELCPTSTFDDQPIYRAGEAPNIEEIGHRIIQYWQVYHRQLAAQLARIKAIHGYALLWDAHSIAAQVPRFFEGTLPDLNLGTANDTACDSVLSDSLQATMSASDFSVIRNGRFKGGYITRHYGQPQSNIHAVQLEISQNAYLIGSGHHDYHQAKAATLSHLLNKMIAVMLNYQTIS